MEKKSLEERVKELEASHIKTLEGIVSLCETLNKLMDSIKAWTENINRGGTENWALWEDDYGE